MCTQLEAQLHPLSAHPGKLRIGFVIDTVEPYYFGGYEKRAFQLARRLAKRHEVTIVTSAPKAGVVEGIRYLPVRPRVATFKSSGYRSTKEALLYASAVLGQCLEKHRFDIIDCNATPYLHILPAWLLARRSGAKLILSVHEALLDELAPYFRERGPGLNRLTLSILRYGYRKLHSLPDCIVACSERTQRSLADEGIMTDGVTHGGVESTGRARVHYSGRLVCIARLVPPKRVSIVLEAFAKARLRGHANRLTIIGDGPERHKLSQLISQWNLSECVEIRAGVTEQEKLRVLTQECDVCLSASLREGLSISTLECLGAGLPVVVSSRPDRSINGALEYLVDGANGLITDGEVGSLVEAVGRISRDQSLYGRLSEGAIETAKRYTWDEASRELEVLYWHALGASERDAIALRVHKKMRR